MSVQDDLPFKPPIASTEPPQREESKFRVGKLDVSVRSCLAIMLTSTVCYMSLASIEIKEPIYTLVGLAIGLYFGQKK